ncbi:hypothetical protein BSL78_04675 [Apostichopus japonicus]|uniref:Reverse transcriptase/retrotransposon-derived protein RNase H-like domain-containing protein n=1 Tax=Stichopus japonicus TaxID=307972 RepID=A0A2G8LDW9_STIJA|nr:hypothetical protein BSL78_04675 [Apostichopus japonicus]
MDPAEIQPVLALKERTPTTIGELRQILGFLGYYRSYVANFSIRARPLYDLLGKSTKTNDKTASNGKKKKKTSKNSPNSREQINWTQEHQSIVDALIDQITQQPVMAYPDFKLPFILHTDASNQGLASVLYQRQEGKLRAIAFASRTLSPAEKNYHSNKLEFWALKWSITDRFRDYLQYAVNFTVFTDNNPLTYVLTTARLNATGQRLDAIETVTAAARPTLGSIDVDTLKAAQENDDTIGKVLEYKRQGHLPKQTERRQE